MKKIIALILTVSLFAVGFMAIPSSTSNTAAAASDAGYYKVTTQTDPLLLRAQALSNGPVIARMPKGTIVIASHNLVNGFRQVTYKYRSNGINYSVSGYASPGYLTATSASRAVVNSGDGFINVRTSANGTILASYPNGAILEIVGSTADANWIKVFCPISGKTGVAYKPLLK